MKFKMLLELFCHYKFQYRQKITTKWRRVTAKLSGYTLIQYLTQFLLDNRLFCDWQFDYIEFRHLKLRLESSGNWGPRKYSSSYEKAAANPVGFHGMRGKLQHLRMTLRMFFIALTGLACEQVIAGLILPALIYLITLCSSVVALLCLNILLPTYYWLSWTDCFRPIWIIPASFCSFEWHCTDEPTDCPCPAVLCNL